MCTGKRSRAAGSSTRSRARTGEGTSAGRPSSLEARPSWRRRQRRIAHEGSDDRSRPGGRRGRGAPDGPRRGGRRLRGATFKCPDLTHVRLNWTNKIYANPDFPVSPSYENLRHSASFREESSVNVAANTVSCLYVIPQTVFQAPYVYKVHRKILSCTGQPAQEIKCNLKKD